MRYLAVLEVLGFSLTSPFSWKIFEDNIYAASAEEVFISIQKLGQIIQGFFLETLGVVGKM